MQKDSAQAKISSKVVGGLLFWLTLYNRSTYEARAGFNASTTCPEKRSYSIL